MSTILHRLEAWAKEAPEAVAQRYQRSGRWYEITSQNFRDRVYWLALFLESRGMTANDTGAIYSYNCPEWVHMDLAPIYLGAKSAGIYPNSVSKEILYILEHTESRFLAVQNKDYFKKIVQSEADLPKRIELIIVFDGDTSISSKAISYQEALEQGKKIAATERKDFLSKLDPDRPAFMIYTSGTTGNPKGALLSQDNLAYTIDMAAQHWQLPAGKGDLFSFLPLCHIAEKIQNIGAGISQRYTVHFCTSFDRVSAELPVVQPSLLLCVPRLWEKMMEGAMKKIDESPLPRKKLALWALEVGSKTAAKKYSGKSLSLTDWAQWLVADRVVLSKIRQALGLAKAEALASGAAALSAPVAKWFNSIGLEIMEDFGQTESTGVICMTERGVDSAGTVGKAVAGIEIKIAEDGELLTRGRHVFKGYFKDPEQTQQALEGGWLHTGDLAEVDARGLIRIRGRKKEVLKTSGGKMIAPLPIEEALKSSPMISQVCMVGDGKKYLSALITLSEAKLSELSQMNGTLKGQVITAPQVLEDVKKVIEGVNAQLPSYEQIKKFAVLSKEFSIAEGEMTPTLKMKRNVIETRYQNVIQKFYESA